MLHQFCPKLGFAAFIVETGTGQHRLVLGLRASGHASSGSAGHGIGVDQGGQGQGLDSSSAQATVPAVSSWRVLEPGFS